MKIDSITLTYDGIATGTKLVPGGQQGVLTVNFNINDGLQFSYNESVWIGFELTCNNTDVLIDASSSNNGYIYYLSDPTILKNKKEFSVDIPLTNFSRPFTEGEYRLVAVHQAKPTFSGNYPLDENWQFQERSTNSVTISSLNLVRIYNTSGDSAGILRIWDGTSWKFTDVKQY